MLRIHIFVFVFVAVSTALRCMRCVVLRYVECVELSD